MVVDVGHHGDHADLLAGGLLGARPAPIVATIVG